MSTRDLADAVASYCRRHRLLPGAEPVLALVSGGADSTCLMGILREVHEGPVVVATMDHGLRPEAAEEARAVQERSREWGLECHLIELGMEGGSGVQERARDARLAAARELAARTGCAAIATGHTASDQAETVLFRIARGSGRTGALGMAPRRDDLIRPLLCLSADDTRAWCRDRGLSVVLDPSNADRRFARARLRAELVPALARVSPAAERHVAEFADLLRDEAEVIESTLDSAWDRCAAQGGLAVAALAREPEPLRRLLVRRLLREAGLPGDAMARPPVERALAAAEAGVRADLPGGSVEVRDGALVAFRPAAVAVGPA